LSRKALAAGTKNQEPRTSALADQPRTKNQELRTAQQTNQEPRTKNKEQRTKNQEQRTGAAANFLFKFLNNPTRFSNMY